MVLSSNLSETVELLKKAVYLCDLFPSFKKKFLYNGIVVLPYKGELTPLADSQVKIAEDTLVRLGYTNLGEGNWVLQDLKYSKFEFNCLHVPSDFGSGSDEGIYLRDGVCFVDKNRNLSSEFVEGALCRRYLQRYDKIIISSEILYTVPLKCHLVSSRGGSRNGKTTMICGSVLENADYSGISPKVTGSRYQWSEPCRCESLDGVVSDILEGLRIVKSDKTKCIIHCFMRNDTLVYNVNFGSSKSFKYTCEYECDLNPDLESASEKMVSLLDSLDFPVSEVYFLVNKDSEAVDSDPLICKELIYRSDDKGEYVVTVY